MLSPHTLRQSIQVGLITAAALGIFFAMRSIPVGTHLSHMDFRVSGNGVIQMCDPANPAFIPVVDVRSPIEMRLDANETPVSGKSVCARVRLTTSAGKTIGARDLVESHTRLLHLLIVDPSLSDYQHVHPVPTAEEGVWEFCFTPRSGGVYRVFADFTPAATGRALYAYADLSVVGNLLPAAKDIPETVVIDGFKVDLQLEAKPLRAGKPSKLWLRIESLAARKSVPLAPVMGAYAHLVAFDHQRSGFAHMHPMAADPLLPPDALRPAMEFQVEIPRAGDFVLWAQFNLGGRECFVPFAINVVE